jgi:hypothetical protein
VKATLRTTKCIIHGTDKDDICFIFAQRHSLYINVTGNAQNKMRIFKTTLVTTIFVGLTFGIIALFKEKSVGQFFYLTIMVSANVIIPVFLGTLMYHFIKKKINNEGLVYFIFKIILFGAAVQAGIIIWATLDVIYYYGDFSGLSISNIINDYKKEFLPWTPTAILTSILIPTVDKVLAKREGKTADSY